MQIPKRIKKKILIFLALVLLLTGCWDQQQLEDLFFVYTAGLDIDENNPELITLSLAAPAIEEEAKEPTIRISSQGRTVEFANNGARSKLYRQLSYGHLEILLFGADTAKEGMAPFLDFFDRSHEVKGTLLLAVVEGRASDFIQTFEPKQHPYIGIFLSELIYGLQNDGIVPATYLREFSRTLNLEGEDPAMPYLVLSESKNEITSCHIAVFRDDQFVHVLDKDQSIAVMFLKRTTRGGSIAVRIPETDAGGPRESLSVRIYDARTKVRTRIEDERVKISVQVTMDAGIVEHSPSLRTINRERLERLSSILEGETRAYMLDAVEELQKYQADIIGFGEYVRVQQPQFFQKDNWREDFARADIDIEVRIAIRRMGKAS